jgi:hypothetical protein
MRRPDYSRSEGDESGLTNRELRNIISKQIEQINDLNTENELLKQTQSRAQEFARHQDKEIESLKRTIDSFQRTRDRDLHILDDLQRAQDQVFDIMQAKDNEIAQLLQTIKEHKKAISVYQQQIERLKSEKDDDEVVILSKPKTKKQPKNEFEGYNMDDLIQTNEIVDAILKDKTYDKFARLLKLLQMLAQQTQNKFVKEWITIMKNPETIREKQTISLADLVTGFSKSVNLNVMLKDELDEFLQTNAKFLFSCFRLETPEDLENFNDKIGQKIRHYLSLKETGLNQKLKTIRGLLNGSGTNQNQSKQESVVKQNKNQTLLYEEEEEREQSNPGRRERGEGNNNNNNNDKDDYERPEVEIIPFNWNENNDFPEERNREITKIRKLRTNINHINCQMCGDTAAFSCAVYYCGKNCRDSQLTK